MSKTNRGVVFFCKVCYNYHTLLGSGSIGMIDKPEFAIWHLKKG